MHTTCLCCNSLNSYQMLLPGGSDEQVQTGLKWWPPEVTSGGMLGLPGPMSGGQGQEGSLSLMSEG